MPCQAAGLDAYAGSRKQVALRELYLGWLGSWLITESCRGSCS